MGHLLYAQKYERELRQKELIVRTQCVCEVVVVGGLGIATHV